MKFCAIGGLAVNAYAEPVVSLDLDVVIVSEKLGVLIPKLKKYFKVETFANGINLSEKGSDLRIQIQTDERYQEFLATKDKSKIWPCHFLGRRREYCHMERLGNLGAIPKPFGFTVSCLPVKVRNAGAGWCRAVAII